MANKRRARDLYLRRTYGMTLAQYELMVKAQNGRCAICKRKLRLYVEHCHESKRVRGAACFRCNKLRIGIAKDSDVELYRRIVSYLESTFDGRAL